MNLKKYSDEELEQLMLDIKEELKLRNRKYTLNIQTKKDSKYVSVAYRDKNGKFVNEYIGKLGAQKTMKKVEEMSKERRGVLESYLELLKNH